MTVRFNLLLFFFTSIYFSQTPVLKATGNQIYCPQTSLPIVESFSITGSGIEQLEAVYIQISTGYVLGQDLLTLTGNHTGLSSFWDANLGKLSIFAIGGQESFEAFTNAVQEVVYSNSSPNPTGNRIFSITIGSANYLESTGHYYEYVPNIGISWENARTEAANRTYFGLQGYLATITSLDEVQITSIQSTGAGWIGGTDEEVEGVWKWVTGPEAGTVFWNGGINGSTPNFAYWNTNEPNNAGPEHYAHVTAPNVGIAGSWNDLRMNGEPSGDYQPKGYIVEYGGMPGDPVLQISATTSMTMFSFETINGERCDSGSVTLQASASNSTIDWFTQPIGGVSVFTGNVFNTPVLNQTTNYYVEINSPDCLVSNRILVTASINNNPQFTLLPIDPICPGFVGIVNLSISSGLVKWYATSTDQTVLSTGSSFFSPTLTQTTTFYFEIESNGCVSARFPATIEVFNFPEMTTVNYVICEGENQILNAGTPDFTYSWSTGATTPSIVVNQAGTYTVDLLSINGCLGTKTFIVTTYVQPIIDEIVVDFEKVVIKTLNQGNFLYSIDGINYTASNVFFLTNGGAYIAYVKALNDCGVVSQPFVFITIPSFFTPNGDGRNDIWQVGGLKFINNASVKIFDKYGKLVADFDAGGAWNGTYNGKSLPSSDYWYVIDMPETNQTFKGHFSLKR